MCKVQVLCIENTRSCRFLHLNKTEILINSNKIKEYFEKTRNIFKRVDSNIFHNGNDESKKIPVADTSYVIIELDQDFGVSRPTDLINT